MTFILFFHVLGVIIWMGSLFVVSRLLAEHVTHPATGEALTNLEERLFATVIHGGAAVVIATGVLLVLTEPTYLRQGWLHAKLLLVLVMAVLDVRLYRRMQVLHAVPGSVTRAEMFKLHGFIGLTLIGIVFLAVVRPF
jgi:protoporphyrinogen IX oxidase